ncbi:MAG: ABC transporter permease [Gemmatimonadales bacterium]|nr:ABC transporter permease [Gemmatimonadales bacterium]
MESLLQDLRFAARTLFNSPGFTIVAVLTLGLGIGANTAIFTVVNTLLLKPPAQVGEPGRLVSVYTSDFSGPRFGASSWVDYQDFKRVDGLSGLASYAPRPFALAIDGETSRSFGEEVSGNYFGVLQVRPALGRFFLPAEDSTPGTQPVAVISHGLWQRTFGGERGVIGRAVTINGVSFTIVGVAPPGFAGSIRGIGAELWVPFLMHGVISPASEDLTNRSGRGIALMGRMKPGVTIEQVRAQFDVMARRLHDAYPDNWSNVRQEPRTIAVLPERDSRVPPQARGPVIGFMAMLMAVVGLVLLICCTNVANLTLARATARQREIAIRLAMGASRGRLVRLLLTESLLLSLLGGAAGALLAWWTTGALAAFQPALPVPLSLDLSPDARVLVFGLAVTAIAGFVFGLLPALRATRPDLVPALKDEVTAVGLGGRRYGVRDLLVIAQVSVSMVLLVMAGLFLRSLGNARSLDPGFDPRGVVMMTSDLSLQGYPQERARTFYAQLLERARALPGVRAASFAESVPLGLGFLRRGVQVEGYEARQGEDLEFGTNTVGPDYFATMGITIVRGRGIIEADNSGAPGVAVVNERFARRFWPGQDAIGKRISNDGEHWLEVVGVAKDGKYNTLGEEPAPYFYVPALQGGGRDMTLLVRTSGDPRATLGALGQLVKALDRDLPVQTATMEEHLGLSLFPLRIAATLLGIFGALGLALAGIGLYGVMAYAVAQRTRELGVRMALGATARDVVRVVVGHGARVVAAGVVLGLAAAFGFARLASSFLFGVGVADPVTFTGIPLLLAAVAVLAGYLPARRATRLDPMAALRSE